MSENTTIQQALSGQTLVLASKESPMCEGMKFTLGAALLSGPNISTKQLLYVERDLGGSQ